MENSIKEFFTEFIDEFVKFGEVSNGCRGILKSMLKKIKKANDETILEFLCLIETFNKKIYGSTVIDEFINKVTSVLPDEVRQSDVVPNFTYASNDYQNSKNSKERSINWVARPPMTMMLNGDSVKINGSMLEYLIDIKNAIDHKMNPKNEVYAVPEGYVLEGDLDDEENYVECIMGHSEDMICLTMVDRGSDRHFFKFHYEDIENGASLTSKDAKYFNDKTENLFNGLYVFSISDEYNCLLGKKLID